ncbi:hypothetical protein NQ318_005140 [Aromia moschata]|uniref:Uncharacterized protein n=1 Tax=Aromia moschata TaxID=1265417 RepID=A0AAV8Y9V0_9CUCU|nr:hypothetical protein NQ318_005140 [Aromia moschata]
MLDQQVEQRNYGRGYNLPQETIRTPFDSLPRRLESVIRVKSALKGTRFESVGAVKAKATEVLNQLIEADFQYCFQQGKRRIVLWSGVEIAKGNTLKVKKLLL